MLLVVVWRIVSHLCCQPRDRVEPIPDVEVVKLPAGAAPGILKTVDRVKDEMQIGWMTEAKDWAGELISGQTIVIFNFKINSKNLDWSNSCCFSIFTFYWIISYLFY